MINTGRQFERLGDVMISNIPIPKYLLQALDKAGVPLDGTYHKAVHSSWALVPIDMSIRFSECVDSYCRQRWAKT